MTHNLFPGPNAAFNNPEINTISYFPSIHKISAITPISDRYTQITTSASNTYVVGQQVRFLVPAQYGMSELNEVTAFVTEVISDTQFLANVNTLTFTSFIPSASTRIFAFVNPIGDVNSGALNSSGRNNNQLYIDGSFRDIFNAT